MRFDIAGAQCVKYSFDTSIFSETVSAQKAQQFGTALLTKGAESVSLKNFRAYDRMLPLQEHLPEGKLGNLIALPLQGRALRNGNSAFVDENWNGSMGCTEKRKKAERKGNRG